MLSIRKINPMARAVGTVGVVMGLVGAVTFAALQSNTVALTPNNLTTATAALVIDASNCAASNNTSTPGFNVPSLAPGASTNINFCIGNHGTVPLSLSASIPQDLSGSVAASFTTLDITCNTIGSAHGTSTLNNWGTGSFSDAQLNAGANKSCTATASLSNGYTGSGGESIPAFTVNFVGTQ